MSECNSRQAPAGMRCVRPEGHDGPHMDYDGYEWSTPDCSLPAFVDWQSRAEAAESRIEAALAYCDELKPIAFGWKIARILRGESDA